ncbi:MAG: hypothetical protein HQL50_14930 [Magnetococcales bacterium]|nr:hypothetical protein [Magnetococcales bacterium]
MSRDRYSSEQLAQIRSLLQDTLGDDGAAQALENLDQRFTPAEEAAAAKEAEQEETNTARVDRNKNQIDVAEVIKGGKLHEMIEALGQLEEQPKESRALVASILKHKEVKSFHLCEALGKVSDDLELVDALVHGIISRKGVNPLIDALKHAVISPKAMKSLALSIADQGTVNHVLRAIASAPKDQPEAEITWAMEVMGKGAVEQMVEALNLIDEKSPGVVVLATGIVSREEAKIESKVRALAKCLNNEKACSIIAAHMATTVDVPSLVPLLEKYAKDSTVAGEIVVSQLVYKSLTTQGREKLITTACRRIRTNSMSGRILAMGICKMGNLAVMEKAFGMLSSCPSGQAIVGVEFIKKKGMLMAIKALGMKVRESAKKQADVKKDISEATARYKVILKEHLNVDPAKAEEEAKELAAAKSAKK